jgi:hypothetical protein
MFPLLICITENFTAWTSESSCLNSKIFKFLNWCVKKDKDWTCNCGCDLNVWRELVWWLLKSVVNQDVTLNFLHFSSFEWYGYLGVQNSHPSCRKYHGL